MKISIAPVSFSSRLFSPVLAAAVLAGLLGNPVAAQWGQQKPKSAPPIPTVKLTRSTPIPDVPDYTGQAVFQDGFTMDRPQGVSYMERLKCRETRTSIIDWYVRALRGSGWKILHSDDSTISGTKEGSICS
ncbi:MAG TPA: hypothetical protein V6C72_04295, partial [Chroococcales cyanobacterium]